MCNDKSGVADGGEGKDQCAWGEVRLTRIYRFSGWPSPMHSGYNDIWPSCFDKDMCKIYTIQCRQGFLRVASDVCTVFNVKRSLTRKRMKYTISSIIHIPWYIQNLLQLQLNQTMHQPKSGSTWHQELQAALFAIGERFARIHFTLSNQTFPLKLRDRCLFAKDARKACMCWLTCGPLVIILFRVIYVLTMLHILHRHILPPPHPSLPIDQTVC